MRLSCTSGNLEHLLELAYRTEVLIETYISVSSRKGVVGSLVPSNVIDPVRLVVVPCKYLLKRRNKISISNI